MITLESDEFRNLMGVSASLRGAGKFDEASKLIEDKLLELHPDCLTNAYLEIFYANCESGNQKKVKDYAIRLHKIEPGLPAIQKYVK